MVSFVRFGRTLAPHLPRFVIAATFTVRLPSVMTIHLGFQKARYQFGVPSSIPSLANSKRVDAIRRERHCRWRFAIGGSRKQTSLDEFTPQAASSDRNIR